MPKKLVRQKGLKKKEEVEIQARRIRDIRELRRKYPTKDLQKEKEEMRKGWGE